MWSGRRTTVAPTYLMKTVDDGANHAPVIVAFSRDFHAVPNDMQSCVHGGPAPGSIGCIAAQFGYFLPSAARKTIFMGLAVAASPGLGTSRKLSVTTGANSAPSTIWTLDASIRRGRN